MTIPSLKVAAHWYANAHVRFGPPRTLTVARIAFIATGVLGALALFGCGLLIGGRATAAIAAVLLTINPLFRLHAHRAMSDVPCEAFLIAGLGLGLWAASRIWSGRNLATGLLLFAAAGAGCGLAIVCKLNGLLGPMILAAWCGLGMIAPGRPPRMRLALAGGAVLAMVAMVATVLALNPTLTCHPRAAVRADLAGRVGQSPWARFRGTIDYRLDVAEGQRKMGKFSRDLTQTPPEKLGVFVVQGFGRFGPFGPSQSNSEVRYERRQDWGVVLWFPLVLFGIYRSWRLGMAQLRAGEPPTALALLVWAFVSWAVVASYLPLAWDRYLLPIQAPNAMLAAVGLAGLYPFRRRKAVAE